MMMIVLLLGCKPSVFDGHTVEPVVDEDVVVLTGRDLQEGLSHLLSILTVIHPSDLIQVEAELTQQDTWCPEVFEGVANTNAWNQHCDNNQGTLFAGRSQSFVAENVTVDEVLYNQYATYISSFVIESADTFLMMNGYGDFYVQESTVWMEMVGTYAYNGSSLSWVLSQQSTAIQMAIHESVMTIEGGISHTEVFPDGLASIRLTELILEETSARGMVVFQNTQGVELEVELDGSLNDCVSIQNENVCYDWTPIKERTW